MPYIKPEERDWLAVDCEVANGPGQLNYQVTMLVLRYLASRGRTYAAYAEIEGVLNHVSKEIYRRSTAPYEDRKRSENGEIFPPAWRG
jgi:hypothetical protein